MARPPKCRHVSFKPGATYFKPRGIPLSALEEVILTVDQLEALRLADLETHTQESAAARMKISRATFGRIVEQARLTVADAIVNSKAILIEGGHYQIGKRCRFRCTACHRYQQTTGLTEQKQCCKKCKDGGPC